MGLRWPALSGIPICNRMKIPVLLVLAWPAVLVAAPETAGTPAPVAVFDFETAHGVDSALGPAIAEIVRAGLGILPPLYGVGMKPGARAPKFGVTLGSKEAADIAGRLGAKALITGRISKEGGSFVFAASVVEADTGTASAVKMRDNRSLPMAEVMSELTLKLGAVVLHHTESEAAVLWKPASLRGSDRISGGSSFLSEHETAYPSAIDGRAIDRDRDNWNRDRPLGPGRHGVAADYYDGSNVGGCLMYFVALPGRHYELRSEDKANDKALLWLADADSGKPVTVWVSPAGGTKLQPAVFLDVDMALRQRPAEMHNSGFTWVPGVKANVLFGRE
jgi:hypothetical protein